VKPEPESESDHEEDEDIDEHEDSDADQQDEHEEAQDDEMDLNLDLDHGEVFEDAPDSDDAVGEAASHGAPEAGPQARVVPPMGMLAGWAASLAVAVYITEVPLTGVLAHAAPFIKALPFILAIMYVWELPAQGRLLDPAQAQATAASLLAQAVGAALGAGKGMIERVLGFGGAMFRMLAAAGRPGDSHGPAMAPLPVSFVSIGAAVATVLMATSASKLYSSAEGNALSMFQCEETASSYAVLGYMEPFAVPGWSHARAFAKDTGDMAHAYVGQALDFPFAAVDVATSTVINGVQTAMYYSLPCAAQPSNLIAAADSLPFVKGSTEHVDAQKEASDEQTRASEAAKIAQEEAQAAQAEVQTAQAGANTAQARVDVAQNRASKAQSRMDAE